MTIKTATPADPPAARGKGKPPKSYRKVKPPVPASARPKPDKPPRLEHSAGEGAEARKEKDSHDFD